MDHLVQIILISVILTNLAILGSHPLNTCIRAVALQGVALGVLPIFLHGYLGHFVASSGNNCPAADPLA